MSTHLQQKLEANHDEMLTWFEHMHRNPELSMQEEKTAAFIAETVSQWDYEVETGVGKHGIVASMTVGDSGKAILSEWLEWPMPAPALFELWK